MTLVFSPAQPAQVSNNNFYFYWKGVQWFLSGSVFCSDQLNSEHTYSSSFQFSLGRPVVDSLAQVWNSWPIMQSQAGVDTGHRGEDRQPGETQRPRHRGHQHLLCHDLVTTTWGLGLSAHYEYLPVLLIQFYWRLIQRYLRLSQINYTFVTCRRTKYMNLLPHHSLD